METQQTARDRERAARFTVVYRREQPRLLAFVHRRTGERGTAEEVTAETFRIAWEHTLGGGELSPGWLFVTARNLLRNHHRAAARLGELHRRVADELGRAPAGPADSAVLDALERLPGRHREVLLLTYWDGLGAAEAGAVLGCTAPAVWVRLHRARRAFRDLHTAPEESA
ncbi:sigma-70 family RNA polymerase sigma factor [Streptomyces sp. 549]|uniref:RNA polymerase sigma factor n=1 Tax=Streptomyces sp. 549 TaxID=3049076 RepID=UPI0024C2A46C|nr:sigma-70 family RNA polymerase sigma factor [Streptomyces sp. 549]MDK1472749.1 sigma-70 family RNA polymerase sigma factor [Streptomyces sp. 549]